ncbi:hypothetical protein Tco_1468151 [Tanacetum coccineum]
MYGYSYSDLVKLGWLAKTLKGSPNEPPLRTFQRWKKAIYEETLRKSDQMHQTFEKSSLAMTRKLDDMIELPKSQPKRTYKEDLECEMVMVKIPRCMSWLGSTDAYDEPIGSLGTPVAVEPLDQMKLEDVVLDTYSHDTPLSSREVPSFDESESQPQPLPCCPSLDVSLGKERGPEPPIKPHSPDSFRMKVVDHLTIHPPSSPHVVHFHPKGLLGSLTKSFSNSEVIKDDFLGEGLSLPVRPVEN